MTTLQFAVPDLSCHRCEGHVRSALAGLPGLESVAVDLSGKRVSVTVAGPAADAVAVGAEIVRRLEDDGYAARPLA